MPAAGLYARISLDRSGEGLGVERQIADCTARAKALGWRIADTYVDNDISASTGGARPQYERLMADLQARRIDAVVVYDLDRLTRRSIELARFMEAHKALAFGLANVVGDVDLATASGRMMATIRGAVAQQESERLGERVKRQKQQRAERGLQQGGRYRALGYTRNWRVLEEEAAVVRDIFQRRVRGQSTTSIAKTLNAQGRKTTAGGHWRQPSVASLLSKPHYAGLVAMHGGIIGKATHEAIVDEATWRAANSVRVQMQPGHNARAHLLSGILRCGVCATSLVGQRTTRDPLTYRCNRNLGGCGRVSVRGEMAEAVIVSLVIDREVDRQAEPKTREPRVERQPIEPIEREIVALRAAHDAGDLDLADLLPLLKDARVRLRDAHRAEAEAVAEVAVTGSLVTWLDWLGMDLSERRALLGRHLAGVTVTHTSRRGPRPEPGRLKVHWLDGRVQAATDDDLARAKWSNVKQAVKAHALTLRFVPPTAPALSPSSCATIECRQPPPRVDLSEPHDRSQ